MSKESFHQNNDLRNDSGFGKDLSPPVLLGLILLLGMALRFYDLGAESYWIDEMSTVIEGQQSIHQLLTSGRLDQPPAYYLPFHLWVQTFGTTEVGTRSFSALAGIGSIVLIYWIGRELFGKPVGLLSAFLMAISGFQIYYSQESRFYSFFEFVTLLSFLILVLALSRKRKFYFVLYVVVSTLMLYSHTYGLFMISAQNLFFILQGKKYKNIIGTWIICQALILLAFLPYFYPLIFGESNINHAIGLQRRAAPVPLWVDPLRSIYRFIIPPRRERSWEVILAGYAAAGALLVVGTWINTLRRGNNDLVASAKGMIFDVRKVADITNKLLLVSCWLLCPVLLPFILSMVIAPIYEDRYTIGAAPALYLLLASGLFSIRKVVPLIVSLGALLIMIVPGLHYYYVTDIKEQWREAALYVEENSGPDEVIVIAPSGGRGIQKRAFHWYYQGTLQSCGLSGELIDPIAISEALMPCISGHNRFWVILRDDRSEPPAHYRSYFLGPHQTAMRLIRERRFVVISVYLFELTK